MEGDACRWLSTPAERGEILETIVWPNQGRVRIPDQYYKKHRNEINIEAPGLLLNDEGIDYVTHFGRDEIGVYMGSGIRIAKEFGFLLPTKVRLEYEGLENVYTLTQLGTVHIPNVFPVQVKEEPIQIISDDEADVNAGVAGNVQEPGDVGHYHFEKKVTAALASVERPQVLHFPNQISKRVLKRKYLRMTLEDVETHKTYVCKIRTAGRRNAEKSLCGEWFDFVKDRGLQEQDLLIFDLEEPPTKMYVQHVRVQSRAGGSG